MKYRIEYEHSIKDFEDVWHIEEKYLEPSAIAPVDQVVKWDKKNNDIHIFVRDKDANKVVGEITLLPLSEEQFNKFLNNELEDTEITEDTLLDYEDNKKYYLCYSAMAIDIEYRNDKLILGLLLKGFYDKLNYLRSRGIVFLNMCAEGMTLDGKKFAESFLNLKCKKITEDGYKLYSFTDKQDFENWFKIFPQYISRYIEKFELGIEL